MFYIVYKTTNNINSKIYVGYHKTDNLHDSYLGSGTDLCRDIKAFGKSNFTREILYTFDTAEEALLMESKIVTQEFIQREDTYNIIKGGGSINTSEHIVIINDDGSRGLLSTNSENFINGDYTHVNHNRVIVKDKDNNIYSVFKDDDRYLSGELVGIAKGKVSTICTKTGNKFLVDKDDPRYISGELVGVTIGVAPPNKGKKHIYNPKTLDKKLISIQELPRYISMGWINGIIPKKIKEGRING